MSNEFADEELMLRIELLETKEEVLQVVLKDFREVLNFFSKKLEALEGAIRELNPGLGDL